MPHTIRIIRRTKQVCPVPGKYRPLWSDYWNIELDSVPMEVKYGSTTTKKKKVKPRITLSNKGVRKHKDYKQIRTQLHEELLKRYYKGQFDEI